MNWWIIEHIKEYIKSLVVCLGSFVFLTHLADPVLAPVIAHSSIVIRNGLICEPGRRELLPSRMDFNSQCRAYALASPGGNVAVGFLEVPSVNLIFSTGAIKEPGCPVAHMTSQGTSEARHWGVCCALLRTELLLPCCSSGAICLSAYQKR